MSGIFGFFSLDGAPTAENDLKRMAGVLERRGPDRTGLWHSSPVSLGHTLLATTPEAVFERLPLKDAETGCVITADVRLDNRDELLAVLALPDRAATIGDAEIILTAYLAWGRACVERFLGDYAFAIWDPRENGLFCARDHFGMRPFNYHHSPGQFFAFASEPKAVLTLPRAPYRINEGRIADFLVSELEGIDKTSTFFEEVYRLPPAHSLSVTCEGFHIVRYWTLKPGPELRLSSDEAYAKAFLDVFTEAVRCRLRSVGPVGSMLSGGIDSGSVVAVARTLLAEQGRGPLLTFSAIGPDPTTCIETRTIQAALTMEGLDPHTVNHAHLGELMPQLWELARNQGEPFDSHMNLVRAVYLAAHRQGVKVVLDGVAGDIVLGEGSHVARLLRAGHWLTAWREVVRQKQFWGDHYSAYKEIFLNARAAMAPNWIRRLYHAVSDPIMVRQRVRQSGINLDFARRVRIDQRLQETWARQKPGLLLDPHSQHAEAVNHPDLTAARERYDRVAAALAIEPRDPFLDRRVVEFCVRLPGEQLLKDGWPKIILRRATAGYLPDAVRWRRGKEHLGWSFTKALIAESCASVNQMGGHDPDPKAIETYVIDKFRYMPASPNECRLAGETEKVYNIKILWYWLSLNADDVSSKS